MRARPAAAIMIRASGSDGDSAQLGVCGGEVASAAYVFGRRPPPFDAPYTAPAGGMASGRGKHTPGAMAFYGIAIRAAHNVR
jgi:hypothetical protein